MKKVFYCAVDASGTDNEFRLRVREMIDEYCRMRRVHTDFRVNMGCAEWDFEERVQDPPHAGVYLADLLDKD